MEGRNGAENNKQKREKKNSPWAGDRGHQSLVNLSNFRMPLIRNAERVNPMRRMNIETSHQIDNVDSILFTISLNW